MIAAGTVSERRIGMTASTMPMVKMQIATVDTAAPVTVRGRRTRTTESGRESWSEVASVTMIVADTIDEMMKRITIVGQRTRTTTDAVNTIRGHSRKESAS